MIAPIAPSGGNACVHGWSKISATGSIISAPAVSWPVVTDIGDMPWRRNRRAQTRRQRIAQRGGHAGELGQRVGADRAEAGRGRSSSRRRRSRGARRRPCAGSCARRSVKTCATTTPQIGVVALRIEARPLAMCVWPQPNRVNGIALLSRASRSIEPQTARGRPAAPLQPARKAHIAAAAMVRRSQT